MTIYVSELPKNCMSCPCFQSSGDFCCGLDDGCNDYFCDEIDGGVCPLQSLSDHTKQVRKEVCEEIKKKVLEYFNVKNEEEYENSLSLLDALFTADVVFEILDKIFFAKNSCDIEDIKGYTMKYGQIRNKDKK